MNEGDIVLARVNGGRLALFQLGGRWASGSSVEWEAWPLTPAGEAQHGRLPERAILSLLVTEVPG